MGNMLFFLLLEEGVLDCNQQQKQHQSAEKEFVH